MNHGIKWRHRCNRIVPLLKSNNHFDGCTSFPAFVNRSYYCVDCERGFNTNDRTNHTCQGRRCSACGRFDCQDFVRGTRLPTISPCVTATFTVPIANVIVWSLSNVNLSKPASSAKPITPLFPTDVTSVGTPNVPCVRSGCLSRTTSVTFNPWWRKRSMNRVIKMSRISWMRHFPVHRFFLQWRAIFFLSWPGWG